MTKEFEWTKETYEKSVSSRCWWYCSYDAGWDECHKYGGNIPGDEELKQIVQMEQKLESVPEWAQQFVERSINFVPPCGHYLFPLAYLEVVSAIGSESPPDFIHGCYTAERNRKERMLDYIFCLDAWLGGVEPKDASKELFARKRTGVDWHTVCVDLWDVLGERTESKELRMERLMHRYRWWVKSHVWDDDARDVFCQDRFLGDIECKAEHYGNPDFFDPYFTELQTPRVKKLKARAKGIYPDDDFFWPGEESWLCAPKAFRFLERALWSIGKEQMIKSGEKVPGFLQCEDTYPEQDSASEWWQSFMTALVGWWSDEPETGDVADEVNQRLGESTPIKCWLVRLFVRRLELHVKDGEIGRLVNPSPDTRRGNKLIR